MRQYESWSCPVAPPPVCQQKSTQFASLLVHKDIHETKLLIYLSGRLVGQIVLDSSLSPPDFCSTLRTHFKGKGLEFVTSTSIIFIWCEHSSAAQKNRMDESKKKLSLFKFPINLAASDFAISNNSAITRPKIPGFSMGRPKPVWNFGYPPVNIAGWKIHHELKMFFLSVKRWVPWN